MDSIKKKVDFSKIDQVYENLEIPVFFEFDENMCELIENKVYLFLRQFFDNIEWEPGELLEFGIARMRVSHFRPHFNAKCKNVCRNPKIVLSLICDLFSSNILYHNQLRMWYGGEDTEKSVSGNKVFKICYQVDPADLEPGDYEKKH